MIDLSKLAQAADPGMAMKTMDGTYKPRITSESGQMQLLPQASMPKGSDPSPFKLGGPVGPQR